MPVVEFDVESVEVLLAPLGDFRDELLRRFPRLLRRQHDRRAVGVVGADEVHFVALHALEPHPDVRLDVLHDVADVERAVRVRQGGGDEQPAAHADFQKPSFYRLAPRVGRAAGRGSGQSDHRCDDDRRPDGGGHDHVLALPPGPLAEAQRPVA